MRRNLFPVALGLATVLASAAAAQRTILPGEPGYEAKRATERRAIEEALNNHAQVSALLAAAEERALEAREAMVVKRENLIPGLARNYLASMLKTRDLIHRIRDGLGAPGIAKEKAEEILATDLSKLASLYDSTVARSEVLFTEILRLGPVPDTVRTIRFALESVGTYRTQVREPGVRRPPPL